MDPIEKLKYSIIVLNILAFLFGMWAGFNLAQKDSDDEQEKED